MDFEYSSLTDVGRVRVNNEDAVAVDPAHGIAVLADGMGGYNAGEVASALAVEQISGQLAQWKEQAGPDTTARDVRRAMEVCVDNANRTIFEASNTTASYAGMGSTLVLAAAHGSMLVIGHIGDSRAYRWRDGELLQLTRDHSLLQEQIDAGLITLEEAAASNYRSLVTRALGVEDTVLLDVQEAPAEPGDVFLLCSDGLTEMVPDEELAQAIGTDEPLNVLCQRLVEMANQGGGRDNIAVALIRAPATLKKTGVIAKLLRK